MNLKRLRRIKALALGHYARLTMPRDKARRYHASEHRFATYSIISTLPPIFHVAHTMTEDYVVSESLDELFDYLGRRRAYFFYSWYWWTEEPRHVAAVREVELILNRRFPNIHFIHCCNTISQQEAFAAVGLDAIFFNHNAMVDERLFYPRPEIAKRFDAIYDARLKNYKRHFLARQVGNLALLYALHPAFDIAEQVEQRRRDFADVYWLNHPDGGEYSELPPAAVNEALNSSRVGLCLSETEGAMFASIQYLLAGLPVVSTASRGGRDVFFDDESALIVNSTPEAVAAGVREMIRRNPSPEGIRARALAKMHAHRQTYSSRVQRIYDQEGVGRDFAAEWDALFFNKMTRWQRHSDTIALLEAARRAKGGPQH